MEEKGQIEVGGLGKIGGLMTLKPRQAARKVRGGISHCQDASRTA